jgi:O-antigen biosynthesis protein
MIALNNIIFKDPRFNVKLTAWVEHIPFAFFLIEKLKPKVFLELGTHHGNSYFAFCQAIHDLQIKSRAYAVDLWSGDEHSGYYGPEVFEFVSMVNSQNFSHFSNLMKMTFNEAITYFNDGTIDLLHIDGMHSYEAVKHDFENWLPKMSVNGVIILHDTNVHDKGFGVWKLLEELREKFPTLEFDHGYGLGVVCTGTKIDIEFLKFINESKNDPFLHNLFAILGNRLYVNQQCTLKDHELDIMKDLIIDKNNQFNNLNHTLMAKEHVISKLVNDLNLINKRLENSDVIISILTSSFYWRITRALRNLKKSRLISSYLYLKSRNKLIESGFFDEIYYLEKNPDVYKAGINPLKHYLIYGGFENRNPSRLFESTYYIENYPDVKVSGMNPLLHYVIYGIKEGRLRKNPIENE